MVANSHFVPLRTPMNTGECQTLKHRTSYTYFHLSNSNPAVGGNEDMLTSGSELNKWLKMSDGNAQWCTKACKLFWSRYQMFLRDIFSMRRTTVCIHLIYKINLITYFAWAYPQHGGVEAVIIRVNASKYWLLFQDNWSCGTSMSILVINVNFSVTATCVFYLSWPINWTSAWTFNCRNSDHTIAGIEHLRSVYCVRYFPG